MPIMMVVMKSEILMVVAIRSLVVMVGEISDRND